MTPDRWYWCIRDTDQRVIVMNLARPESEWMALSMVINGSYDARSSGRFADRMVDLLNGRITEPAPTPEADAVSYARGCEP